MKVGNSQRYQKLIEAANEALEHAKELVTLSERLTKEAREIVLEDRSLTSKELVDALVAGHCVHGVDEQGLEIIAWFNPSRDNPFRFGRVMFEEEDIGMDSLAWEYQWMTVEEAAIEQPDTSPAGERM